MSEPNEKHDDDQAPAEEAEGSASSSEEVGSLLSALLSETRKEVDRERSDVAQRVQDRQEEARASQERDEAQRREELQAQLLAETRKRNEALTRREREGAAEQRAEDALLALEAAATPAAEIDDLEPALPQPSGGLSGKHIAMAAALILGVGAGVGVMSSSSQPKMELPDIESAAEKAVSDARLKWQKEQAEKQAAMEAAARKEAEAKAQEAARAQLEAERKALDAERKALEAERLALEPESEGGEEAAADGGVDKKKKKKPRRKKKRGLKLKKGLF
ncbi:MAG: hypothetical protein VX938_02500 [Myxococcota bacterium]|nr:hypothetical protein [Myxococcota bacterium]